MSARPYHKRYHSDALTGYRALTLEQRGAYTTILDLLYDSGEDALPGLERWMAGQLGVSARKWRTIRDELAALGKITVLDDGRITNRRYLRELEKQVEVSRERAEAGSKGGRSRQDRLPLDDTPAASSRRVQPKFGANSTPENELNHSRTRGETSENANENNGHAQASACDLPPYARAYQSPESRVKEEESQPTAESCASDDRRSIDDPVALMGSGFLPCLQNLARVGAVTLHPERPGAFSREADVVKAWIRDGIDLDATAIPAIAKRLAAHPDTVGSLKFYDRDVRKAHALTMGGGRTAGPSQFDSPEAQAAYLKKIGG